MKIYCRLRTVGSAKRTSTWWLARQSTSLTELPQGPTPRTLLLSGPRSLDTSTSLLLRYCWVIRKEHTTIIWHDYGDLTKRQRYNSTIHFGTYVEKRIPKRDIYTGDIQCWRECWDCGERHVIISFLVEVSLAICYMASLSTPPQVGLSSDPGQGVIIAARDYERQFSAHMVCSTSYFG